MATAELKREVAEVLLTAIAEAAPDADGRGTQALESLARAYALVVEAAPKPESERRKSVIV